MTKNYKYYCVRAFKFDENDWCNAFIKREVTAISPKDETLLPDDYDTISVVEITEEEYMNAVALKSKEEVVKNVTAAYYNANDMLNLYHFDFDVVLKEKDLLQAYAELQKTINGDLVLRLDKPVLGYDSVKELHIVSGEVLDFIPSDNTYENVYSGNMMDFLVKFVDKESSTGFCRVCDGELENVIKRDKTIKMVIGQHVSFVL